MKRLLLFSFIIFSFFSCRKEVEVIDYTFEPSIAASSQTITTGSTAVMELTVADYTADEDLTLSYMINDARNESIVVNGQTVDGECTIPADIKSIMITYSPAKPGEYVIDITLSNSFYRSSCSVAITAVEPETFTLNIKATEGGTVQPEEPVKVTAGEEVAVSATPDEGYTFHGWDDGIATAERVVTVISDSTITALFGRQEVYTVNILADEGGRVNPSGQKAYVEGSEIRITATPEQDYFFSKWSDGELLNPRTLVVSSDTTVTALFEKETDYAFDAQLTLTPVEHNYANIERDITLKISDDYIGDNLTMSYRINDRSTEYLYRDGQRVPTDNYTLDTRIDKVFYFTYTATEREDKHLKLILENSQTSKEIELLIPVTDPLFYTVNIIADPVAGGTVEPFGTMTIQEDTYLDLTAVPSRYFDFAYWDDGSAAPQRKVHITSDSTFTATFREYEKYNIRVSATEGGTAVPSKTMAYRTEEITLTATASEHYDFSKWSDGNTQPVRTMTVTGDITLQAIFVPKIYDVTTTVSPAGSATITGAGEYAYNTAATVNTQPFPGYLFGNYSINGNTVTDNPYRFTVTGKTDVVANLYKGVQLISLSASTTDIELSKIQNLTVRADIQPADAKYKTLQWRSSDASVAYVDQTGNVSLRDVGYATVTATSTDGTNISGSLELRVHDKVYGYITVQWYNDDAGSRTIRVYFNATRTYDNYLLTISGNAYTESAMHMVQFQKSNIPLASGILLGETTYPATESETSDEFYIDVAQMSITTADGGEQLVELVYDKSLNQVIIY